MAAAAAAPRPERRLAAVLATDVVGFSRLVAEDETGTLARLRSLRKEVAEPLIAAHGGRTVKLAGDGAIVEFPSAVEAVLCTVLFQRGVAERERDVQPRRRIRFRAGINLGDIVAEDGDVYGDGVNVAARLQELAEPGGILVARNIWNQVKAKTDLAFRALGERRLKNIPEPVAVYAVRFEGAPESGRRPVLARLRPRLAAPALALALLAAVAAWALRPAPDAAPARGPMPDRPSLAVLAFDNFSGDPEQGYLADGMAEDVITELARNRDLVVMARGTSFSFKGKGLKAQEIARELGVRYVLEGSVRRGGERIALNTQLIDGRDGRHIWAERIDVAAADVYRMQSELVARIAGTLLSEVRETEQVASLRRPPDSLDVYELTLRGLAQLHRLNRESLLEGRRELERAIELDPGYAPAHIFLGLLDTADALSGFTGERGLGDREAALARIEHGVRLDPHLATGYQALGFALVHLGRLDAALAAAERSVELGPGDAENLTFLAKALSSVGRHREALARSEEALRLSPLAPVYYLFHRARALYALDRFEDAAKDTARCLNKNPGFPPCRLFAAASVAALGRADDARQQVAQLLAVAPRYTVANADAAGGFPRDPALNARFLEALRQAELPEAPVPSN